MVAVTFGRVSVTLCILALQQSREIAGFATRPPLGLTGSARLSSPYGMRVVPKSTAGLNTQTAISRPRIGVSQLGGIEDSGEGALGSAMEDFMTGAGVVNHFFWDLFWNIYGRAALGVLMCAGVFAVTYAFSPELGISLVDRMTNGLASLGLAMYKPVSFLPLPDSVALSGTSLMITGGRSIMDDTSLFQSIVYFSQILFIAPIVEEFIFRRCIMTVIKNIAQRKPSKTYRSSLQEKRQDLSTWAVISSLIFGFAHLINWIRPLEASVVTDAESVVKALTVVSTAVAQCYAAFIVSIRVFTPVFEDVGFAASVGSHVMWNFSVMTSVIGLPLRAVGRFFKWVKEDEEDDDALDLEPAS